MARKPIQPPESIVAPEKKRQPKDRPVDQVREVRSFTQQETRQQRLVIAQLWINGVSDPGRIANLLEKLPREQGGLGYRIGKKRATRLLSEVRADILDRDNATLREEKIRQRERLMRDANNARAEKKYGVAIQAERLIAELTGTLEPLQVEVRRGVGVELAQVVAELAADELDLLVEQAARDMDDAKTYRAQLPPKTVEATSVEVVPEGHHEAR